VFQEVCLSKDMMAMRLARFNRPYSIINNTAIGVMLVQLMTLGSPAAQAGPQSILDPYASIQPASEKAESRSFLKKKEAKKQAAKVPASIVSSDAAGDYPILPQKKASKIKIAKRVAHQPIDNGVNTASSVSSPSSNPGFLAGVKEIQHGYITTFKAAGQGIVSGSKVAGSKVAESTKSMFGSISSASHKVAGAPRQNNQGQIADNSLPTRISVKDLPGKPLDQAIEDKKRLKKAKDKPVTDEIASKPSKLCRTFNKLNFLNKKKKVQAAPMTASNPNGMAR
jgi:hypothetical protein